MRRRRRIIVSAALATVLCVAGWLLFRSSARPDPIYKGKPLSMWLSGFDPAATVVVGGPRTPLPILNVRVGSFFVAGPMVPIQPAPEWLAADEALHHYGTNAFPTILWMLRARDSAWRLKWYEVLGHQRFFKISYIPAAHWNRAAITALKEFSEYSASAVPVLAQLYDENLSYAAKAKSHDYPAEQMILEIPEVLGKIGPKASGAIPSLMRGAAHTNANIRWVALEALGDIRSEVATIVPFLVNATKDPDQYVRMTAARALAKSGRDTDLAIPAIISLLTDPQVSVREASVYVLRTFHGRPDIVVPALAKSLNDTNIAFNAALALQDFGAAAQPAVPSMIEFMNHETNANRRGTVANIIKQIDPEAAAKAGVK